MNRSKRRNRRLTARELRAIQATPGLMVHRVSPEGRHRLEQLTAESTERRKKFARRLTDVEDLTHHDERGE